MRILITNVYSYKNKGDAAIVLALLQEARRVFPGADITIQTTDTQNDHDKYGAPTTPSLLWLAFSSVRGAPMYKRVWKLGGLIGLMMYLFTHRILGQAPQFILTKDLREFVRQNQAADIIIACGGGYLCTESASLQNSLLLFGTCLNFLAAKYVGKPVYLYSQSIGPVYGRLQYAMLRFALNRVDLIEPREEISLRLLKQLSIRTTIIATADPALLLNSNAHAPKHIKLDPNRMPIGITVRKWFRNSNDFASYTQAIAQTIDYLIEHHQAQVFYIPQVIAQGFDDDDRLVADRVLGQVQHKRYFTLIDDDLHPFEIIGLCGRMHAFIGTRMHSNIFSLINHTPVIAIEYEHKTRGIMRGLGLDSLVININDVTYPKLRQRVDDLLANHARYQQLIAKNLPGQIQKSRMAMEKIGSHYNEIV